MTKINCGACGRFFTDETEFKAHRVGLLGQPSLHRCLTDAEMTQGGWDSILTPLTDEPDSPTCRLYFQPSQDNQGTH